ncbi:unnamed protein product, partial [Brassica rapa]
MSHPVSSREEEKKRLETVPSKNVDMEDAAVIRVEEVAEAVARENEVEEIAAVIEEDVLEGNLEINIWLLVSPSKAGRSPVLLSLKNQVADFQISGSKFSVLSNEDEEEGEI